MCCSSDIENWDVESSFCYENACIYKVDESWAVYTSSVKPQTLCHGDEKKFDWVSSLNYTSDDLAEDLSNCKRDLFCH